MCSSLWYFYISYFVRVSLTEIRNEMGEKLGLDKRLMLTEVLVKPLQKRFSFHFYGSRRTNNIEKVINKFYQAHETKICLI